VARPEVAPRVGAAGNLVPLSHGQLSSRALAGMVRMGTRAMHSLCPVRYIIAYAHW
jgi:hypothetical protein